MINYKYNEEKIVALFFAELLKDDKAKSLIESGEVKNSEDATWLSQFFWKMVDASASNKNMELPCEGGSEYWTEKLYNTFGGYLERAGFEEEWNREIDNA